MAFYQWSETAATNGTADASCPFPEGMAPSAVNDGVRGAMARLREWGNDIAGAIVTAGTNVAYTVTSNQGFDTLLHLSGQVIAFTPHTTNGATVTLNVDGLGAKPLRTSPGVELLAGTIIQGTPYVAVYNNTDGAFYLQGFYGASPYLIPLAAGMEFWGTTAPNSSFAFPFGQAISRTTYATLFAIVGTTFGVGDGSTTFNIPDVRGRVIAGVDNMGGSAASRLTSASNMGTGQLGQVGGAETVTLNTVNLPAYTPSGSIIVTVAPNNYAEQGNGGASAPITSSGNGFGPVTATATFTGNPQGGNSTPTANVMPAICANRIMRII